MKIRYVLESDDENGAGPLWPVVYCEVCDRRVEDAENAVVLWDGRKMRSQHGTETYAVHCGKCLRLFEKAVGRSLLHHDMDDFLNELRRSMEPRYPEVRHALYVEREGEDPERVETFGERLRFLL